MSWVLLRQVLYMCGTESFKINNRNIAYFVFVSQYEDAS